MRVLLSLSALAILAACTAPTAVSSFNGDSVTVDSGNDAPTDEENREAQRICQTDGRRAEYASTRSVYTGNMYVPVWTHLYLCLDPSRTPVFPGMVVNPIPVPQPR